MTKTRIDQLLEMLKEEPFDSFLNYALALEYGKLGEVSKAIEIIEIILARDENYLGGYYQLGQYYELTNDSEKAISTYKKGILIAAKQQNRKASGELREALQQLED